MGKLYLNYMSNIGHSKGLKVSIARNTFNKVKKELNAPGFRKGHMPRAVFNQKFGEEALYEDALNAILPAAYEAAVAELELDVVAQPKIDVTSMEKGQDRKSVV